MGKMGPVRLAEPCFERDEIDAVVAVLKSGQLVQGACVERFEKRVAEYLGVREAVACANGTASLHLAFLSLDLNPGDEVILPDFAFPSAANMVELSGAVPVPVDIDLESFNMDPSQVEARISERTRAIMPVHLFGLMTDLRPLLELGRRYKIPIVEDAACALGATRPLDGRERDRTGHIGADTLMGCVSFHPRKVITTAEGGMIVTNDEELAGRLRRLRNHGADIEDGRMAFFQLGFNYRMTELQGALGVGQMKRLEQIIARRRGVAAIYDERLEPCPVTRPAVPEGFRHVYQAYVVVVPEGIERDAVVDALRVHDVEATIGTYALHPQPYYRNKYALSPDAFPQSRTAFSRALALPVHQRMTEEDTIHVANALFRVLEELSS